MKNLFEIDSDEIKRILSLHEESTKKQYLNVISEQSGESITLPAGVYHKITAGTTESVISLPNGTIFSKTNDPNILISYQDNFYYDAGSKRIYGKISYNCTTGKFIVPNSSNLYNGLGDLETKYFKPFCQKGSQQNTQTQTKTDTTPKIEPKKIEKGTTSLTPEQQLQRANKAGYKTWAEYKENEFAWKGNKKDEVKTGLTPEQQLQRANKAGYKTWAEYKDNEFAWKGNKTVNRQQQFVQNTVAGIYKLQTDFLGVPTPTGQLTTKDIDTLLTKLQ